MLKFNDSIHGRILFGHVVKKLEITTPDLCEIHCFTEAECASFNVIPLRNGKHQCQLSDSDHRQHSSDMIYEAGAAYTPVVVIIIIIMIIIIIIIIIII